MPLRDHFRPPTDQFASWEGLHGGWPMVIVQHLRKVLPAGFTAEPRVHIGSRIEIDIAAFEKPGTFSAREQGEAGGGVATLAPVLAEPSLAVETSLPDQDEYEVLVYDASNGRRLVAAIEIVSPANKDRPENRNMFVAKCFDMMRGGVAVTIVDLVTIRRPNLYVEFLAQMGHSDLTMLPDPPPLYAASCRWVRLGEKAILQAWSHTLALGQPLPTLPLWLADTLVVSPDLESSYEQACHDLWIP